MLTTDLLAAARPRLRKRYRGRFYEPSGPSSRTAFCPPPWFKLTHRDNGSDRAFTSAPLVPKEALIWQDPIPGCEPSADRGAGHLRP